MKTVYCDSYFWVRLFFEFPDSERARAELRRLRADSNTTLPLTWLHRMEVTNACNHLAFQARSGRLPRVTPEQAAMALANFRELAGGRSFASARALSITDVEPLFCTLSERHTTKHGFRTYDLIHVSSAMLLGCERFLSF